MFASCRRERIGRRSAKSAIVSAVASVEPLSAITSSIREREVGQLHEQALEQ